MKAAGADDWAGWVELQKEPINQVATQNIARVMLDVGAGVQAVVEVEDRTRLERFNRFVLGPVAKQVNADQARGGDREDAQPRRRRSARARRRRPGRPDQDLRAAPRRRGDLWDLLPTLTEEKEAASDHAAIWADLKL